MNAGHPATARGWTLVAALLVMSWAPIGAQAQVTSPEQEFGFRIGSDYQLINYQELSSYWETLAGESDRMTLQSIGKTSEGRDQLMAIITSPENHANLDRYKEISATLSKGEISEDAARALAEEGKAIIWIDGGLHATEVLGAQQLTELVWQMVSRDDNETMRILDDVVLLVVHANPDGHDLVADWYMRESDPLMRSTQGVPLLYNKYAGHDNNRDFYMAALAETENMNRVMYREWYPQIVYNHHQTGPAGTIMFAPPFRDPPNHNLDPLIITGLDQIGSAMHGRFVQEGKPGTTMRGGAPYSTWWNGGLRTTPYFHNQIGLLTETIGHPTPIEVPFLTGKQITRADLPLPIEPQVWHFRQSVDYSQTANRAVLDFASRYSEHLLYNLWKMGSNSIARGSTDSWTVLPKWIAAAQEELGPRGTKEDFDRLLRDPAKKDARGYIMSSDQASFATVTRFVNTLLKNGITVHEATDNFTVEGQSYPAGSYVVTTAQAFRPHIIDMFEPQNHPDDFAYPGSPPTAPYDNAGWTLALQMGVEFERIMEGFSGPFREIDWMAAPAGGVVAGANNPAGYLLEHDNAGFTVTNRVLANGGDVLWLEDDLTVDGETFAAGTFYIAAADVDRDALKDWATELGVSFHGVASTPSTSSMKLQKPRIALWDTYGGSMPSGWIRYTLEDFEFDYDIIYPPELDEGRLRSKYDVILLPDGAMGGRRFGGRGNADYLNSLPDSLRSRVGSMSDATVDPLREFLEDGGTVIAIGSSTALGMDLGLPIEDYMVDAAGVSLDREVYFTPGSVHDIKIEAGSPLTHGIGERAFVLHSHSPVFKVAPNTPGIRRIAWYDSETPLVSGWAWGQEHLEGGTSMLEADVGSGKLFLFGPKITFRAQSHGTFPLLFNGIYYGSAERNRPVS